MGKLKLNRPLAFFDLETTGTDIVTDRIVQIAVIKLTEKEGKYFQISKSWLINPQIAISKEASEVHGITFEDVIDKPTFREVHQEIKEFMDNCDLCGYNSNRFDVPILAEEFMRCGILFPDKDSKLVDCQVIFHEREPRDLASALQLYTGKEIMDAHDALADTSATLNVLFGQLEMYEDLPGDIDSLHEISKREKETYDYAGKLLLDEEGEVVYGIGKAKGVRVINDPGFGQWMLDKDFPEYTKYLLRELLNIPHPPPSSAEDVDDIFGN
jgi:DNA polymerase-3 subunit epsilon